MLNQIDLSRIDLNQEVTDSTQIANAGFRAKTLTEILNDNN